MLVFYVLSIVGIKMRNYFEVSAKELNAKPKCAVGNQNTGRRNLS